MAVFSGFHFHGSLLLQLKFSDFGMQAEKDRSRPAQFLSATIEERVTKVYQVADASGWDGADPALGVGCKHDGRCLRYSRHGSLIEVLCFDHIWVGASLDHWIRQSSQYISPSWQQSQKNSQLY